MKTVGQVTKLTGISARTLQYYDEIAILKPSKLTDAGYRLYDDAALRKLQQILFFKELGFKLEEIRGFLSQPDFDQRTAYKRQKELLLLKKNRIDKLIQLLDHLEKGEQIMSFKEFDLSDYILALEDFKNNSQEAIIRDWGNIENFEAFIQKVKDDEVKVAELAIKEYGSVENYTKAMRYNLEHFSEIMESKISEEVRKISEESDTLYVRLVADRSKDVSSDEIQDIVQEIDNLICRYASVEWKEAGYWHSMINTYKSDYVKSVTDKKYGAGAADYIVEAFQYFAESRCRRTLIEDESGKIRKM